MRERKEKIVHKLLLDTKANIAFPSAQLTIYQPSIKEIAMLGEHNFLVAVNSLTKNYKKEVSQDKIDLESLTNFDILMSIVKEKTENSKFIFQNIFQLLELILPNYKLGISPGSILCQDRNIIEGQQPQIHMIDSKNFDDFAQIIYEMFALDAFSGQTGQDYNPGGDRARALVEQFRKKRELLAKLRHDRGEDTETSSIFGRYLNILAVGEQKDKNELSNYSVYQLIEEFKRFQLKETFDYTVQAKMAGATKIKDAKDWMQEIDFGKDLEE